MPIKQLINSGVKIALAILIMVAFSGVSQAESTKVYITVHSLKKGKTPKDAEAYYQKLMPIFKRHGLSRLDGYKISGKIAGHAEVTPVIMHIWKIKDASVLSKIVADKDYLSQIPLRDSIFNMPKMQGWLGEQQ